MNNESSQPLPPNGRLISAGMAAAAAIGLLLNHFMIESQGVGKLMILAVGPIALFLGIGGIVEPKILWSVGNYGKDLPVIYKLIGGALGAVGVAISLLLLFVVYSFGPPEPQDAPPPPKPAAATPKWKSKASQPAAPLKPERRVTPQKVMLLTYDRPNKRWVPLTEEALQGVRREETEGVTTLHYAEGGNALLKVLWPDILEVGDRFSVEVKGANSLELVDLDGADANARSSFPTDDTLIKVEIVREKDQLRFTINGQPQKLFYASGKLRGDEGKSALLGTSLRPGFTIKKGEKASFRNATIVKP